GLSHSPMMQTLPLGTEPVVAPRAPTHAGRLNLAGLDRQELAAALLAIGVPEGQVRMRVRQLWHWLYNRGARSFEEMTSISKELLATLAADYDIDRPQVVTRQISVDGTRKWLIRLEDGNEVETVFIPDEDRGTLCVSSQVGCTLTCRFCHTGTQRLVRNLTAGEILSQVLMARERLGDFPGGVRPTDGLVPGGENRAITNIVMMGMGEPLYNYDNVKKALLIASDGAGLSLSKRRITLSTSGV